MKTKELKAMAQEYCDESVLPEGCNLPYDEKTDLAFISNMMCHIYARLNEINERLKKERV